ncbi:DMT family transporter [Robiginitalea aurantiaca]|uniref:DMT family transporter n=1 Tax=Robiginitalea aurantiaca TaxID=3056915 RepID=A0ABT7WGB6_9FLAO|nr:DMT family transporter [Robiginitalea aurantiaca]MDM9631960.1 DMT family transporter [Robiginitalea aurantiaca]
MWDLIWSICCSSIIFVVFKLFDTYGVDTFRAIIVNYFTALGVGLLVYQQPVFLQELPQKPWFAGALLLGSFFILIFNLMALTSQRMGVSVASVATKMSLVIPVVAGIALYKEQISPVQATGITLALAAVYFTSMKSGGRGIRKELRALILPALVFLGSGVIDTSIKYLQHTRIPQVEYPLFSALVFGFAGTTGILLLFFKKPKGATRFNGVTILGGIALGVPNFFSIYFLLRALQFEGLNSASIFTLNNVAIVMLTTLAGIVFFKEKLSLKNWMGIFLAVISILLISLF